MRNNPAMGAVERLRHADVEGLRVGRFAGRINTTCILWRLGGTLIDTGPANQWAAVRRFAGERPTRRVVVTHHHEDHAGNLARLARLAGVEQTLAPAASLAPLAEGFELQPYRRVIWGRPPRARPAALAAAVELEEGGALEAVPMPGHSPDMTCLLAASRGVLFGADLYVARRQRYLRADERFGGILASLRRARGLDFDTLLCSHRGVVEDAHRRLGEKLAYFEELQGRALELAGRGWPVGRITRRLLGREGPVALASGLHYSKRNLILGCLGSGEAG